jgi:hypothetical protein
LCREHTALSQCTNALSRVHVCSPSSTLPIVLSSTGSGPFPTFDAKDTVYQYMAALDGAYTSLYKRLQV